MDEMTKIGIIVTMVSAVICPMIASVKNRSAVGWFFGGLLLGGIGFIIICCLPSKKSEREIREEIREEIERYNAQNRKYDGLREQERDRICRNRIESRSRPNDVSKSDDEYEDDDIF